MSVVGPCYPNPRHYISPDPPKKNPSLPPSRPVPVPVPVPPPPPHHLPPFSCSGGKKPYNMYAQGDVPLTYDPVGVLHGIIKKVAALDKERYFFAPVTEAVAPGYFKVISQPMALATMMEKASHAEYGTWRAFCQDFQLICDNAMTFNPKRSRVFKCAQQFQKVLRKTLQVGL